MGGKRKLVPVYYGNYLQAQIVKGRLESEGVPVVVSYEGAGQVFGVTVDGLGEARVMVPEDLAAQAEEILAQEYGEPDAEAEGDITEEE